MDIKDVLFNTEEDMAHQVWAVVPQEKICAE
jgi:hypothetical protein